MNENEILLRLGSWLQANRPELSQETAKRGAEHDIRQVDGQTYLLLEIPTGGRVRIFSFLVDLTSEVDEGFTLIGEI